MAKMSFRYLMGLLEECHRFENMKFKKISESRLVGNRVVVMNIFAYFIVRLLILG